MKTFSGAFECIEINAFIPRNQPIFGQIRVQNPGLRWIALYYTGNSKHQNSRGCYPKKMFLVFFTNYFDEVQIARIHCLNYPISNIAISDSFIECSYPEFLKNDMTVTSCWR